MIRSLFISATGLGAQKLNMDVISNNLANVNTAGYKKSRADFQEILYQDLKSPGAASSDGTEVPTGIMVGLGVRSVAVQKIFMQGDIVKTGNELDVAIEGKGFYQILKPDGEMAYSRAGAFKLDSSGTMVNSEGLQLEPAITLPADAISMTISSDGTVSAIQQGSPTQVNVGQIELARFVNPGGLRPLGRNLYIPSGSSGTAVTGPPGTQGLGNVAQGFLELSNVDIVEEMVSMIVTQRAYEIISKGVQASDEMLQMANNLKR